MASNDKTNPPIVMVSQRVLDSADKALATWMRRAEALQSRLDTALTALQGIGTLIEAAPELNMANYDEGQVEDLNNAGTEICLAVRKAIKEIGSEADNSDPIRGD